MHLVDPRPVAVNFPLSELSDASTEALRERLKEAKQEDKELAKQIGEMEERVKLLNETQRRVKNVKLDAKYTKKDTTPLGPDDEAEVFIKFRTFTGRYVFHCHNLEHEDHAMMGAFRVIP